MAIIYRKGIDMAKGHQGPFRIVKCSYPGCTENVGTRSYRTDNLLCKAHKVIRIQERERIRNINRRTGRPPGRPPADPFKQPEVKLFICPNCGQYFTGKNKTYCSVRCQVEMQYSAYMAKPMGYAIAEPGKFWSQE